MAPLLLVREPPLRASLSASGRGRIRARLFPGPTDRDPMVEFPAHRRGGYSPRARERHLEASQQPCWRSKGTNLSRNAWFRHEFALPETARGKDLVFVLGGYDEQDWKQHWIYLNGTGIGESTVTGRWHTPGRYSLRPTDPAYGALKFGPESRNLLAVRARGYDLRTGELLGDALEQYVFRPFLFDQFISVGEPYRRVSHFELVSHFTKARKN